MRLPNLPVVLAFHTACLVTIGCAARNISIDDQDPLFVYTGKWQRIIGDAGMDKMGGHMLAESPDAFATITYTFTSVYFLSPLWPYKVTTDYRIDGSKPIKVDLQDHSRNNPGGVATVPSNVVAKWLGNVNKQRTIRITVPPGDQFAVVDMFTFVVHDSSNISSTTSSRSTTTSSTHATSRTGTTSSVKAKVSSTSSSSSSSRVSPSTSSSSSSRPTSSPSSSRLSPSTSSSSLISTSSSSSSRVPSSISSSSLSSVSSFISSSSSSSVSPSISSSSSSSVSPSISSSSSQGGSSSIQLSNFAIAMAILGTSVALLTILLLWWFCIHRKNKKKTDGNISPHYHPLPTENITITPFTGYDDQYAQNNNAGVFTTPMREGPIFATGYGANIPLTDNSSWMRYDDASSYEVIQSDNLQQPLNTSNHYPQASSSLETRRYG